MKRIGSAFVVLLAASLPAAAEEIALKDGTKIVGHMNSLTGDKIEVVTAYGKMLVKRSDIITISFPENNPGGAPAGAPSRRRAAEATGRRSGKRKEKPALTE